MLNRNVDTNVLIVYRNLDYTKPYSEALERVGLHPVLKQADPSVTIGSCSGLLLMGGTDVNPALYGETAHQRTEEPDDERDRAESVVISEALARDLPILAICRGLQMLNVHLGGSLIQHLETTEHHQQRTKDRGLPAHQVIIEQNTLLESIAGCDTWHVNSRHHQAIGRLGTGLQINARDPEDGVIEGVELPGRSFVVAVQWHPENQAEKDPNQRKLFQSFANAVCGR